MKKGRVVQKTLRKTVTKVTPKSVPKQPKRITKVYASERSLRRGSVDKSYLQALIDPFQPAAMGAQIPDEYPFPTATYHLHNTVAVNTPAASSTFQGLILPSPTITYVDAGGAAAANGFFSGAPVALGTGGAVGITAMTTDTVMASLGSAARVVGFGIRIKNNMNFSTVQGRVIVAPIIVGKDVLSNLDQSNLNGTLATSLSTGNGLVSSIFARLTGLNSISSSIQNLPGSFEFAMDELIDKEFLFSTRPIAPSGKDFKFTTRSTINNGGSYNAFDNTFVSNSGTGLTTVDNTPCEMADCGGMIAFAIYAEGMPAGTVPLLIETICHLEFQPRAVVGTPTPSNNHFNNTAMNWVETLQQVANSPMGRLVLPATAGQMASLMGNFSRMTMRD